MTSHAWRIQVLAGLALLGSAVGCAPSGAVRRPTADANGLPLATIDRVIDGDTVRASSAALGWDEEKVRLIGLDAPEDPPDGPPECFGPEAGERLAELTPPGSRVSVRLGDEPRDRFGRVLAHLLLPDGTNVGMQLVAEGYATVLTIRPNVREAARFEAAAARAREAGRGLWTAC